MSIDQRSPKTDPSGDVESTDTIADALDNMAALAAQARDTSDPFGAALAEAILAASRVGTEVRLAHFRVADAQQAALKDIEKGADAAVDFAARSGQNIDRNAVLKDAAQKSAATALAALGNQRLHGQLPADTAQSCDLAKNPDDNKQYEVKI